MFPYTYARFYNMFVETALAANCPAAPYQGRHSGISIDRASGERTQEEAQKRGRWRAQASVRRYEKAGRLNDAWQRLPQQVKDAAIIAEAVLPNKLQRAVCNPPGVSGGVGGSFGKGTGSPASQALMPAVLVFGRRVPGAAVVLKAAGLNYISYNCRRFNHAAVFSLMRSGQVVGVFFGPGAAMKQQLLNDILEWCARFRIPWATARLHRFLGPAGAVEKALTDSADRDLTIHACKFGGNSRTS